MRWVYDDNRVEYGDVEEDEYSGEYVDCHSPVDSALMARMVATALNDCNALLIIRRWAENRLKEYEDYVPDYVMRFEDGYIECLKNVLERIEEVTSGSAG